MASTMPPVHPKRNGGKSSARSKPKAAPTRSARRSENGHVSTGTDVPHMIRVTVLGLAGVTVDQGKCRPQNGPKGYSSGKLPGPPSKMRALVAFSRGGDIRGTTTLSKPLSSSPKNQIMSSSTGDGDQWTEAAKDETSRHVAVWAASDKKSLGSEVAFEATLHRSDMGGSNRSMAASSAFAPKSFDVTIALTEDENSDSKIAVPFGVANLAIAGDECADGKTVTLDLPVMSLDQARPLSSSQNTSSKNGEYPLISIQRKDASDDTSEKRKRSPSLKRRFFKHKSSVDIDRKAFSSAYSIDPSGDAVLRVTLQVFEKGLDDLYNLRRPQKAANAQPPLPPRSTPSPQSAPRAPRPPRNTPSPQSPPRAVIDDFSVPSDEGRHLARSTSPVDHPDDEISAISRQLRKVAMERLASEQSKKKREEDESNKEKSSVNKDENDEFEMEDDESRTESYYTDDGSWTYNDGTLYSLGSTTNRTDDYTLSFSPKGNSTKRSDPDDQSMVDSHNESFGRKHPACSGLLESHDDKLYFNLFGSKILIPQCRGPSHDDFEFDDTGNAHVPMEVFGRVFKIPVCGAFVPPLDEDHDNDTFTTYTKRGSTWDDELTMVSAKLFGRKVKLPFPRNLFAEGVDNDSVTTATDVDDQEERASSKSKRSRRKSAGRRASGGYSVDSASTFGESHDETDASFADDSVTSWTHDEQAMVVEIDQDREETESDPSAYKNPKKHKKSPKSKKSSESPRRRVSPATPDGGVGVVEIDQDRADSASEPSIYKVTGRAPVDTRSSKTPETQSEGSKQGGGGTMVVEIDQDRADSVSDPTIYKLPGKVSRRPDPVDPSARRTRGHSKYGPSVKKSPTDTSPKGVSDINDIYSPPAKSMEGSKDHLDVRPTAMAQAFTDFLACRNPVGHESYEPYEEVPPVIIGAPRDDVSIGDLTATTHEQRIASARKVAKSEKGLEGKGGSPQTHIAIPAVVGAVDKSGDVYESVHGTQENYFSEYGDDSSLHPINGKQLNASVRESKAKPSNRPPQFIKPQLNAPVRETKRPPQFIKPWVEGAMGSQADGTTVTTMNTKDRYFTTNAGQEVSQLEF